MLRGDRSILLEATLPGPWGAPGRAPDDDHNPGRVRAAAPGPGPAWLEDPEPAGRDLVCGLHLRVDRGRVLLRVVRYRRLFSADPRVAGVDEQDHRPGHRGAGSGSGDAAAGGQRVHREGIGAPLRRGLAV